MHLRRRWVAAGALLQVNYYFAVHLPFYNEQVRTSPPHDYIDAYYRLHLLPPDIPLYFVTNDLVPIEQFYALDDFWNFHPLVTVVTYAVFTSDYVAGLPSTGGAFFIDQENTDAPALLQAHFADIQGRQFSPYNVPLDRQYALYYLPQRTS